MLDLLQPGDVSDVLAAGLSLPASFRSRPAVDPPLSLLEFPSSAAVRYTSSHPLRQDGADRWRIRGSSADVLLTVRDRGRAGDFAAGVAGESSALHAVESGRATADGHLSPKTRLAGLAVARGAVAAGLSIGRESHSGLITSTRFEGIESSPGSGTGYLAWTESHPCLTAEVRAGIGRHELGLSYRQSTGGATASTVSDGQGYRVRQEFTGRGWSPYWAWREEGFAALGMLSWSAASSSGPVLVGNLVAGSMNGRARAASAAAALRSDGPRASQMWSVEHARQSGDLQGSAGGFLFPGILSRSYGTRDHLGYERYVLRYGRERRNGATSLRAGVMLSYGRVDLRLLATRARFLRPPIVLADERLDDAPLWVLAPCLGGGLKSGDFQFDVGASVYLALLGAGAESAGEPGEAGSHGGSRVKPSYRWGVTVSRLL